MAFGFGGDLHHLRQYAACRRKSRFGENMVYWCSQKREILGLRRLMEIARVNPAAVDTEKVGFCIGPRINAAGRMEHADLAFGLLNTESDAKAIELSSQLNRPISIARNWWNK